LLAKIGNWPRALKRALMYSSDALALPVAFWFAAVVKADALLLPDKRMLALFGVAVVTALVSFHLAGLYRLIVRLVVPRAGLTIMLGVLVSAAAVSICDSILPGQHIAASIVATYSVFAITLISGSRWFAALILNSPPPAPNWRRCSSMGLVTPAKTWPTLSSPAGNIGLWGLSTTNARCAAW